MCEIYQGKMQDKVNLEKLLLRWQPRQAEGCGQRGSGAANSG